VWDQLVMIKMTISVYVLIVKSTPWYELFLANRDSHLIYKRLYEKSEKREQM